MWCENMTSLGRKEDPRPEERGVVTAKALALHKYVLAQSLLTVLTSSKAMNRQDEPQGEKS